MRSALTLGVFLLWALLPIVAWPQAFPINSDVALQPAEGQWIYRTQFRWRKFEIDATTPDTEVDLLVNSHVLVYGWTSRFSTVLGVPLIYRRADTPAGDDHDFALGDIRVLARYQVWKELDHLSSRSWTFVGGLEIPSYEDPFSSRSWDVLVGSVYTWRRNRQGFDIDFIYQLNTESDRDSKAGDAVRYDLGFQHRLWPSEYTGETKWTLTGLLELNGEVQGESEADGHDVDDTDSHQIFLSPGLVLAGRRTRIELGIQIPVYRDVGDKAAEDELRTVFGFTWTF